MPLNAWGGACYCAPHRTLRVVNSSISSGTAFKCRRFCADDPQKLSLQTSQTWFPIAQVDLLWKQVEQQQNAVTIFDADHIIAIVGLDEMWFGTARVWALMASPMGFARLWYVHCRVWDYLNLAQKDDRFRRIEATAQLTNKNANRWLGMLGFKAEGVMKQYHPTEGDHMLYARIAIWPSSQS